MTHQLSSPTRATPSNNDPLDVGPADPDGMFSCQQCSSRVNSRVHLQVHIRRTHLKIRPYKCTYCPKSFFIVTWLREHMRRHTGERPFSCSACSKAFITAKGRNHHYERMHERLGTRTFKCLECNTPDSTWLAANFKTRIGLLKHRRDYHNGGRQFHCPYCSKSQLTRSSARGHIRRWHSDRHYSSCSACKRPTIGSGIAPGFGNAPELRSEVAPNIASEASDQAVGSGESRLYECSNCQQVLASFVSSFSFCMCGEQLARPCTCKRPTRGRRLFGGGESDDAEWKEDSSSPFVEWWFAADALDWRASELEEDIAPEDNEEIRDNFDEEWQHVLAFCTSIEKRRKLAASQ